MTQKFFRAAAVSRPAVPASAAYTNLAVLGVTFFLASCSSVASPEGTSAPGATPAPVQTTPESRGQALYGAAGANCVQCHANPATMRRDAANAAALADRIAAAIAANTGRMGDAQYRYTSLTRSDLLDLGAYIVSQAPIASPPPATPPPATPPPATPPPATPPPVGAAVQCNSTGSSSIRTETVASGLSSPWGMAFLPDRQMLVTQKRGSMVLVSANGATRTPLSWGTPAPQIIDAGQGGLLDVALDPDFATTRWVYFTYSEPGPSNTSGTAVGRARLQGTELVNFQRLYQQTPKEDFSEVHFGSRLAFRSDGTLFVSLGDRTYENFPQSTSNSIGKIIRINADGTIPVDNPFRGQAGALPELWSVGHRNPQGLTYDSTTGALWNSEHGPQGGDEVNFVRPGANYGWPLRSYGCRYGEPQGTACRIGGGTHAPLNGVTFSEPLTYWAPTSMAPSNMIVYRGLGFPEWNGQLFVGGLGGQLWRITLSNGSYSSCERLQIGQRIRDVREGPDGWIWLLTDSGEIRRVVR